MPGPSYPKEQQVYVNGSSTPKYVTVSSDTTYETRHQPTTGEIATIKDNLPAGYTWSIVGPTSGSGFDYSYLFSRTGTDFAGNNFVSTPAPVLVAQARTTPRSLGNNFPFSPQNSINVLLSQRFPPHSLHPSWTLVYAGVNLPDAADRNAILTRGYNSIAENVPNKSFGADRLNILVAGGYDLCSAVAARPSTPESVRVWLQEWANDHKLIDNQAAGQAMGREGYAAFNNSDWSNGNTLAGITPNFEVNQASPRSGNDSGTQWRNMDGYFMQGFRLAAQEAGKPVPPLVMYDWGNIGLVSVSLASRDQQAGGSYGDFEPAVSYDPEPGIPFYFSYAANGPIFQGGSKASPLGVQSVYGQYIKQYGGYAGSSEYMRNTWPDNESHWQKNSDGSFKIRTVNGVRLLTSRTDAFRTTINGETVDILGAGQFSVGESDNFLYLTYERLAAAMADLTKRAGKHLPKSTDRLAEWENLKLVQWQRHDAEFKQQNEITKPDGSGVAINPATGQPYDPVPLNKRPHNCDFIEGDVIGHLLLGRDMYRFWMEGQPNLSAQGGSVTNGNHTRASYEIAQKATLRLAQLNWIRDNAFQYILPDYLIRNADRYRSWYDPKEEREKKPILFGGLCASRSDRDGKPYLWFYGRYPAQDPGQQTVVKYWWVDAAGSPITASYTFTIVGRGTYLDDHEVPAVVANLPPSRFRIQCVDMTGDTFTRTGDYRDARFLAHPTPPNPAPTTGVVPIDSTPVDASFISYPDQGWADGAANDLKYIENEVIKIGFRKSVGACVCYAMRKDFGENVVNDYQITINQPGNPRYGQRVSDVGRQWQFGSDYWTPGNNWITPAGTNTSTQGGLDTGANVVQGGSQQPDVTPSRVLASAIVSHPTRGQVFYAKVRAKIWSVPNEDGPIVMEMWCWLDGIALQYHVRHTVQHSTHSQQTYQSVVQEKPCAYIIAPMSNYRVVIGSPGSASIPWQPGGVDQFSPTVVSSECWFGGFKAGNGQGVALYSPTNACFTAAQFEGYEGDWQSGASAYISSSIDFNFNNNGVYEDAGYIILGNESQVRAKIASLPGPDQSFDFDFSITNAFGNSDCRVIRQANNDLIWHIGDSKTDNGQTNYIGNFMSPVRAWQAGGITSIAFEMAVTGASVLGLKWRRPGQLNGGGTEFRKTFPVTGDGVMRTYTVSTSDTYWTGIISSIGLEVPYGTTPSAGANVIVKRFRKV